MNCCCEVCGQALMHIAESLQQILVYLREREE